MTQRFGFKIKTRLSFEELDNVIGQYSQAPYQITIGGMDESGPVRKKIMIIYFEKLEDRERIKHMFLAKAAKVPMGGAARLVSNEAA